jgi:hypothetical protein
MTRTRTSRGGEQNVEALRFRRQWDAVAAPDASALQTLIESHSYGVGRQSAWYQHAVREGRSGRGGI